jgi:transcriptional regulator with GAF, ATPase, and Fis domain
MMNDPCTKLEAQPSEADSPNDVPSSRRVADYLTLFVSHDRAEEAERHDAKARLRTTQLEAQALSIAETMNHQLGRGAVVGKSAEWRDVLKKAMQVAATDATVFLGGESGTGKEVVARFIHRASARRDRPFVAINCAALPETLLESELFGYERGAFTGAQQTKPGQIELAASGVLFLDEVSEMSPAAQAKFLRVLQEREFQRLGGTRPLKTNARVIAASNRDLRDAVERGEFREDLYYRLQVFDIDLPPLRDRTKDIPLLAESFLEDLGEAMGRRVAGLSKDAIAALVRYRWPGNVRELRNVLERAAILCDGGPITVDHLALKADPPRPQSRTTDVRVTERRMIEQVLRETGWNKAKAARQLGLTRTQLYVRLRKYDLEKLQPA